ncbi:Hypothetical_protein [Hexamita inflata]|uniref:Hypothetical_protein n=1 Tax=Hexamita inflata TaxID=28002 RepID=A0AA86UKA5_9EUKA|nr:Hypothetical protein HINF_LOCUS42122 [Hexamita inflata]
MQRRIQNQQNSLVIQQNTSTTGNIIRITHDKMSLSQIIGSQSKYSFNLPSILKPLWNSSVSEISTTVERNSVKFFEEAEQLTLNSNSSVEYQLSQSSKQIFQKKLEQNTQLLEDMEKKLDYLDIQVQVILHKTIKLQQKTDQLSISFQNIVLDK